MNKPRPYYILVELREVKISKTEVAKKWCMEFGDYSRKVVLDEMDNQKANAERGTKINFKVYKLQDAKQKTLEDFVASLNA